MCLLGLIIPFKVQGLECILLESLRTKTILAHKDMKNVLLFQYLNSGCSKVKPFWSEPIFFPDAEEGSMCSNGRINISS
jgi:hypothetical protein